jgi:hypothetical protein
MRAALQRAAPASQAHYARGRPEQTPLYRLVRQHYETFAAEVAHASGAGLPQFVKDEFEAYLDCGILAHGFLRLTCDGCVIARLDPLWPLVSAMGLVWIRGYIGVYAKRVVKLSYPDLARTLLYYRCVGLGAIVADQGCRVEATHALDALVGQLGRHLRPAGSECG